MCFRKRHIDQMQARWNERLAEMPEHQAANVRLVAWASLWLLLVAVGLCTFVVAWVLID